MGIRLKRVLKRFHSDEQGVTALEYALIGTLVAIVIIVAVAQIGQSVNSMFNSVATNMPS